MLKGIFNREKITVAAAIFGVSFMVGMMLTDIDISSDESIKSISGRITSKKIDENETYEIEYIREGDKIIPIHTKKEQRDKIIRINDKKDIVVGDLYDKVKEGDKVKIQYTQHKGKNIISKE